jgi:ABC-type transport system involved in multi-copper enzyme maturation permease subunit
MSGETQTLTDTIDVAIVPLADFATGSELATWWLLKAGYSILPNFQVLWLSDAVTQNIAIPTSYLLQSTLYGVIYTAAALAAGVLLFQRRDLG